MQLKIKDKEERLESLKMMEEAAKNNEEKKLQQKRDMRDKLERDIITCNLIYPKSQMDKIREEFDRKVNQDNLDFESR